MDVKKNHHSKHGIKKTTTMKINDEHMFTPPLEQLSPKRQVHFQRAAHDGEEYNDNSSTL